MSIVFNIAMSSFCSISDKCLSLFFSMYSSVARSIIMDARFKLLSSFVIPYFLATSSRSLFFWLNIIVTMVTSTPMNILYNNSASQNDNTVGYCLFHLFQTYVRPKMSLGETKHLQMLMFKHSVHSQSL